LNVFTLVAAFLALSATGLKLQIMYRDPNGNERVESNQSLEEFQMHTIQVKMVLSEAKLFEGIGFMFLGLGFIFIGSLILFTLKSNFNFFYKRYWKSIIFATLFLGVPQLILAGINISIGIDQDRDPILQFMENKKYDKSRVINGICFYIFGVLIPTIT